MSQQVQCINMNVFTVILQCLYRYITAVTFKTLHILKTLISSILNNHVCISDKMTSNKVYRINLYHQSGLIYTSLSIMIQIWSFPLILCPYRYGITVKTIEMYAAIIKNINFFETSDCPVCVAKNAPQNWVQLQFNPSVIKICLKFFSHVSLPLHVFENSPHVR